MSTFNTIGDFVWASNDTRDWQEEEMEQQERSLELMYMHQQYHGIIEKQQYTLRGSKLSCSYGTDYSLLDTVQDHGIYKGELPVLTTIDCGKSNICDFGSCLCPESNYAGRLPMTVGSKNGKTAKKASYNKFAHICIPMVPEGSVWQQVDHSIMAKTCAKGYVPLLLDSAALVCQYGGFIKIVEVPQAGTTQGKEQLFMILDSYLAGNISDIEADKALTQIAGNQTLDVYISKTNTSGKNYERYDNYIIGWTEYFNDRLGIKIDTAIIKAMLWKESKMGYAHNSSPNANISVDVMQVLDPRNPTIYEYCTYNLDTTTNVKIIGVTGAYVLPITVEPTNNYQKTRTTHNTPVADRLFSLQSDGCYHYQYQNASPLLSIALGIKTYTIKLQVTNGNALLAVQEYNANPTYKVKYMNDVNALALNGGFADADQFP